MKRLPFPSGYREYQWFLPLTVSPVICSVVTSLCYFTSDVVLSAAPKFGLGDDPSTTVRKVSSDPVEDVKRALKLLETSQGKELAVDMQHRIRDLASQNFSEIQREFGKYLLFKDGALSVESFEGVYWLARATG